MKRRANAPNNAAPKKRPGASVAALREALTLQLHLLAQQAAAARNQREQLALYRRASDVRHQLARLPR